MSASEKQQERKFLYLSCLGNVLVGSVAVVVSFLSESQAILLDGLFNLTYFATGLFTVRVATLVTRGDDERFPYGYAFFEPLVNGLKGVLVLGVSVMAFGGAVQALLDGGRAIAAGYAIVYGVFATIVCWVVAALTHRGAKATQSPLVGADAENWIVNAAISSCVLLAFAGIFVFRALGWDDLVPYVDPVVVLTVVAISIGVPVRMAWNALMDLLNKAPDRAIVDRVTEIVDTCLAELNVQERFVRVIQPGRQRLVMVHVVLDANNSTHTLSAFDALREKTQQGLRQEHPETIVDVMFTADRRWGAPVGEE